MADVVGKGGVKLLALEWGNLSTMKNSRHVGSVYVEKLDVDYLST